MNIWHDFPDEKITKDRFFAVVEIPAGAKNKYELDKDTGMLRLDRVLYTSTRYPANYGFIPRTYALDRDPLDVLVLCQEPMAPLTLVECYPVGVLKMTDAGDTDEKIIAVPLGDPTLSGCRDLYELPHHKYEEIRHFFTVYKELEGKTTAVDDLYPRNEAERVIEECRERYRRSFGEREKYVR